MSATSKAAVSYAVDLTHPASHLVRVTITIPETGPATQIQFPAWNALYQIRDFVRNVQDLQAKCSGQRLVLAPVDLDTWTTGSESCSPLVVTYEVYANKPGVFSSELIPNHAFLNLAEVLFYLPGRRSQPERIHFILPEGWKLATFVPQGAGSADFTAPDYDALVDSPVEAGDFQSYSFQEGGADYRVIVRGDPADYSASRLLGSIKKIAAAETALMRDVPFSHYTFIFHFLRGGGGMEHRNGTAIAFPAAELRTNWEGLESTIAHEFFHLWNVKRIRPQGLEPVDYVHGNDTRDLWFSEGVTNTYMELALLRAGLISRRQFYENLAGDIQRLEERPARHFQSAELSGLEAWLEKYPDYGRPERSISYYNKGELLGYLLDLGIRHASSNHHSLDDLMRLLNQNFAKQHRFFTDRDLEQAISTLAPPSSWVETFFGNKVTGTQELDYKKYLGYAGLELLTETSKQPDWGFQAVRNFDGLVQVISVEPESGAARAGLEAGDVITQVNGQTLYALPREVTGVKPGQKIALRVRRGQALLMLKFNLGSRPEVQYRAKESPNASAEQLRIRNGWLEGKTAGAGNGSNP
ncbi:MAG TPA: PDZ domain-containing protein [Terriglobia bacterium]|nr:PDZ domain-containing protein [Terriglobia bacterium]